MGGSRFRLYGLALDSDLALPAPTGKGPGLGAVALRRADGDVLGAPAPSQGDDAWFAYRRRADGVEYVCWRGLFDFLVSADGRRVTYHALAGVGDDVLITYLLGQVLSFALLKQDIEPLHATVVVVDGVAIGFLGDCGSGKSTTAAAFLQAGHRLLTDDLLVVSASEAGALAHPGPARIKLFPKPARALLGARARGVPMNGGTSKLVIPLDGGAMAPAPLRALYLLAAPTAATPRGVAIRRLTPRRAFIELVRNSFNIVVWDPVRLAQQFQAASWLAGAVPVKRLTFPRTLSGFAAVRKAVERDVAV